MKRLETLLITTVTEDTNNITRVKIAKNLFSSINQRETEKV